MSSAQLDTRHELLPEGPGPNSDSDSLFGLKESVALKEEVAARLAAHRARRQRPVPAAPAPIPIASPTRARAARIAATVAERYAHSESYRSFLAAEAQTAIRQAEAAAEVAAVTARAVAEAQLNLLEELDSYSESVERAEMPVDSVAAFGLTPSVEAVSAAAPVAAVAPQGPITVRLYEEVGPTLRQSFTTSYPHPQVDPLDDEGLALDDEIAFRQSPNFEEAVAPTEIPANLIEFPRQLVAARRARPRLAEGPLREDSEDELQSAQLRIFEVEPTQMSAAPAMASAAPEWSSILLDAQPVIAPTMVQAVELETLSVAVPVLMTAPLELRILSAAFDTAIVLAGMLAFATAAILTIGKIPGLGLRAIALSAAPGHALLTEIGPLVAVTGFTFLFLSALYQGLFFTFSEATPGMRYARIGLCTFSDENPTRRQMRRRILATLVSACPLGLGLMWSWADTDRLGWHDRMSRMYQRSY